MKTKIFHILLFSFLLLSSTTYGNTSTQEYCEELFETAKSEYLKRNHAKSIEILIKIQPIVTENKFTELEMSILNLLGINYADLLAYDKAMEYFLKEYELAVKFQDLDAECAALNNISVLYEANNEYGKVLDYLKKAYNVSIKLNDSIKMEAIASNIATMAIRAEDIPLAEQYLNIAKNIQTNDINSKISTQIVTVELLLLKGKYSEAETMALNILQEDMDHKQEVLLFFLLSKIYQNKRNLEKAIYYINEILHGDPNIKEKMKAYDQLSSLYQENNSLTLALSYKDSVLQVKDSLDKINNRQYVETSRIQMELFNSEKQLTEYKTKQKTERTLFICIIVFIAFLAIILIWTFRIQSIKSKQRKQIAELELEQEKNQKLIIEQQLIKQETLALLEQERLNNKNRQLAAKVLIQSNKNEIIEKIIQSLSKVPVHSEDSQLQSIIKELKSQLDKSEHWDDFLAYFEQVSPDFLSSLKEKHPELTVSDIRYLSYMFLNFSTKEIASLLNISLDSCQKKRQRLANKLGVETNNLYSYLLTIE